MSLRVGILGCGNIGARHAGAVAAVPGLDLVGCCGRDMARTSDFAARHGGAAFPHLDAMIDEGLDLLIITIPPYARGGEVEHAAERRVNLLVEKPITLDLAQAEAMADAVEQTGVVAAIGFMYRFGDAVRAWRAANTGTTALYAGAYHCNALHSSWWPDETLSGGQIVEQVLHQIDLIRHLMGEPDSVYARRANLFHRKIEGYSVEDVSAILFSWDDGRIATLNASNVATPGVWHKDWAIFAERMTGRFSGWNDAVITPTRAGAEPRIIAGPTDPFVAQVADVAAAIREGRQPYVPLREGVGSLRLALAARQSADEQQEIRL